MDIIGRVLPDFLGIGAMRAGTSWLARHLGAHPSIRIPRKEIHFFDRKLDRRIVPFVEAVHEARLRYAVRFVGSRLRDGVAGEFTPAYALLDTDRIATIRQWMPNVRLLFIMRDPVERAWSQARHDYAAFLDREARSARESELIAFFRRDPVRARGAYAECLERWLESFERDRFFLTFLEDVVADPERVLRQTFGFLGVATDIDLSDDIAAPVHAGERAAMPSTVREFLLTQLRPQDERLEQLVGRPLPWRTRSRRGARG